MACHGAVWLKLENLDFIKNLSLSVYLSYK